MSDLRWVKFASTWHLEMSDRCICQLYLCRSTDQYFVRCNLAGEDDPDYCLNTSELEDAKRLAILYVIKYCSDYISMLGEVLAECANAAYNVKEVL